MLEEEPSGAFSCTIRLLTDLMVN